MPALILIQTQFLLFEGIESIADCIVEKLALPD